MLSPDDILRIATRVAREYRPLAVGVFGSYAIGTARQGSDLDLFVIRESAERPELRRRAVQRILFDVLHPLDVHVFTPGEFEESVYHEQSFTWVIARQARIYHWVEDAAKRVPSLLVRVRPL